MYLVVAGVKIELPPDAIQRHVTHCGMQIVMLKHGIAVNNPTELIRSFQVVESENPYKPLWITLKPQDYFLWVFPVLEFHS